MKLSNKWTLYSALAFSMLVSACSSSDTKNKNPEVNHVDTLTDEISNSSIPVQEQLNTAKQNGQVVFMVLTSTDKALNKKAYELATTTARKSTAATVVTMDRDQPANKVISDKWELNSIPLPAIFVVSARGIPASGYSLDEATVDDLLFAIPTPKMDEALEALNADKAVFLVVSSDNQAQKSSIISSCKAAATQLKNGAAVIEIDKDSKEEKPWLDNLDINSSKAVNTVVINTNGEKTDVFHDAVTTQQLIASVKKVVTSACCPSGGTCK